MVISIAAAHIKAFPSRDLSVSLEVLSYYSLDSVMAYIVWADSRCSDGMKSKRRDTLVFVANPKMGSGTPASAVSLVSKAIVAQSW